MEYSVPLSRRYFTEEVNIVSVTESTVFTSLIHLSSAIWELRDKILMSWLRCMWDFFQTGLSSLADRIVGGSVGPGLSGGQVGSMRITEINPCLQVLLVSLLFFSLLLPFCHYTSYIECIHLPFLFVFLFVCLFSCLFLFRNAGCVWRCNWSTCLLCFYLMNQHQASQLLLLINDWLIIN